MLPAIIDWSAVDFPGVQLGDKLRDMVGYKSRSAPGWGRSPASSPAASEINTPASSLPGSRTASISPAERNTTTNPARSSKKVFVTGGYFAF